MVADSELSARTLFATVEAGYPLLRSRLANVRGALGLDFVNQTVRFGSAPISRDRLRVAYLRLEGDGTGERGRAYAFAAELRRGLDIFDAGGGTVGPSRVDKRNLAGIHRKDNSDVMAFEFESDRWTEHWDDVSGKALKKELVE